MKQKRVWQKVNGVLFSDEEIRLNSADRFRGDFYGYSNEVVRRARYMLGGDVDICINTIAGNFSSRTPLDVAAKDVKYDSLHWARSNLEFGEYE